MNPNSFRAGSLIEANGFLTLQEPAAGAGGMVLAAVDVLLKAGFDPGAHMLVNAIDVSPLCFHMTYMQLCLRGIPAYVEHANTLSLEHFAGSWTPVTLDFHRLHGRLFPKSTGTGDAEIFAEPGEQLVLL